MSNYHPACCGKHIPFNSFNVALHHPGATGKRLIVLTGMSCRLIGARAMLAEELEESKENVWDELDLVKHRENPFWAPLNERTGLAPGKVNWPASMRQIREVMANEEEKADIFYVNTSTALEVDIIKLYNYLVFDTV